MKPFVNYYGTRHASGNAAAVPLSFPATTKSGFMDPLHLAMALGPVAVYFLLLGLVNISRKPFITNGSRDAAVLGLAVCGLFMAGPMELFMPQTVAQRWAPWVWWLLVLALYLLSLTLLVLLLRPRIVIYNMTADRLRPTMATIVKQLDSEARWAGECLTMPTLGVQLHLESFGSLRNVQLKAAGPQQNFAGWRRLEGSLREAMTAEKVDRNPYGVTLIFMGSLMAAAVLYTTVNNHESVSQSLAEMLKL